MNTLIMICLVSIIGCSNNKQQPSPQPEKEKTNQTEKAISSPAGKRDILVPPRGKKYFGAFITMRENEAEKAYATFAEKAGKQPAIHMIFRTWPKNRKADFPQIFARNAYNMGAVPMITWEPWWGFSKTSYPMLADIADGKHDQFLIDYFKQAASLDKPYFLRFAHEMEGAHYPWSERFDKKQTAQNYIRAFRHITNIARKYAPKSIIVWSPAGGAHQADKYYPGDSYVDWIGASVYNFPKWPQDPTFHDAMGAWIRIVRKHKKPAMVCEMGCAEAFKPDKNWDPNGDGDYADHKGWIFPEMANKPTWLNRFFDVIENEYPEVLGCIWFHVDKEADWRIDSSKKSLATFKKRIKSDRYLSAGQ